MKVSTKREIEKVKGEKKEFSKMWKRDDRSNEISVVIDHWPSCGGIWLDKRELEKIISQMREAEASLDEEFCPIRMEREWPHDRNDHEKDHYVQYRYKKKSRSGRLFDIFD